MNREEKAAVIDQVAGDIASADAIFAVDYRGITVAQVAELRTKLRGANATLRVVKNSLSERAADQAGVSDLKPMLVGPTALAFVAGDAALAAKALSDTARVLRGPLEFKGGLMNGLVLSPGDVQSIARLPARDVLYAQLVGTVASPISGLVRTLNALISGLAVQLGAIAEQGLVSGGPGTASSSEAEPEPASAEAAVPEQESAPAEPEPEPEPEPESAREPQADAAPAEPEAEVEATPEATSEESEPTEGASDDEPSDEKE